MKPTVQLVLPGLFDLPLAELEPRVLTDELPHLNRILQFATPRPNHAFSIDAILQATLRLKPAEEPGVSSLPLAQAMAPNDNSDGSRLLLFEAIHLLPDMHSAIVVPIAKSKENLDDIYKLINDLGELFDAECKIEGIADGLFLMQLKQGIAPTHYPHLLSVLGKAANPYIEQTQQILSWHKLLNEMQMFLHQHPLNQLRWQRGQTPINSLWFWGGGCLRPPIDAGLAWYCDDLVLHRFALSCGLNPKSLQEIELLQRDRSAIVVELSLIEILKSGNSADLDQILLDLDRKLLQPLLQAVGRNRQLLRLRSGFELDYELRPLSSLKFWRPACNLIDINKSFEPNSTKEYF